MSSLFIFILELVLLILLITGSAFFSSAEMSLFSLSRARIDSFRNSKSRIERTIYKLMNNYNRTLVTIILSNMFVNSCISMLNDDLIGKTGLSGISASILSAIIAIVVLLLFGEITPMTLAYVYCNSWSRVAAYPVAWLRAVLLPVTIVVERFSESVLNLIGRGKSTPLSHEEYETYISHSVGKGAFSYTESEFLKESLEYSTKEVSDVMTPRVSMGFIKRSDPPETVERIIRNQKQRFIAVGTNTPDDADAILLTLYYFMLPPEDRKNWAEAECTRPAIFLPLNCSVMLALRKLRETGELAALIPDEYGGIAGLISQADILLHLTAAPILYERSAHFHPQRMDDNRWIFDALTPLDVVSDMTGWDIPDSVDSNTLNGLLLEQLEGLPERNSVAVFDDVKLRVVAVSRHRASRIEFSKTESGK